MARRGARERELDLENQGEGAQARWSGLSPARGGGDTIGLRCGTAGALIRIRTLTFAPVDSTTPNGSTAQTVEVHERGAERRLCRESAGQ
jgi:hypothetical protein